MKKKSPPYAIIGAVILGILAVVFVLQYLKQQQAARDAEIKAAQDALAQKEADDLKNAKPSAVINETPTNMRPVLYATQPIEAGIRISAPFFEKKLTPNDILPDAYTDGTDIVGWFASRRIEKGDPLTPRNVSKVLPTMASRLSLGMRALSLPVFNADSNSTGGFIVDGDKVDLLWTTKTPDGTTAVDTRLLLQNLKVLYVPGPPPQFQSEQTSGLNPVPPPGDVIAVTFEVTPEQAQMLILLEGAKNGQFNMILRATRDTGELKIKPFTADDFDGNPKKVQTISDTSLARVQNLQKQIEAEEKTQGQGNTNETPTPTPTPPSP